MSETIAWLLVGAAIGGSAAYVVLDRDARGGSGRAAPDVEVFDVLPVVDSESEGPANAAAVEMLLAQRSDSPGSYTRDFELEVRLAELAQADPAGAARLALRRGLPARFVESVFKQWAESDPEAALDELRSVRGPAQRTIALALTDVLGVDPASIEAITSRLPELNAISFQIDALDRLVVNDPYTAIEHALDLPDPTAQRLIFADLGMAWGRYDPVSALAAAETYPQLGSRFTNQVMQQWARVDVRGFLDHLIRNPGSASTAGFDAAALADPEAALSAAERLSSRGPRMALTLEALRVLARRDTAAAIARAANHPVEAEREGLLRAVASAYAEIDPAAAYAWLETANLPSAAAREGVLTAMATSDLETTLDLALASEGLMGEAAWFRAGLREGPELPPDSLRRIASKVLASQSESIAGMLQALGAEWARTDPEGAVAWAVANGSSGAPMLKSVASELGSRELDRALLLSGRLPTERRATWIADAAAARAPFDPRAAFAAVERIREEPDFASAVLNVVRRGARRDADAVAGWVARLPTGELRDRALGGLLETTARMGWVDASWLGAFSSPTARQNALLQALRPLASAAPAEAQSLVDTWFTDPDLLRRAEAAIGSTGSRSADVTVLPNR